MKSNAATDDRSELFARVFGARIRRARERRLISQRDFAAAVAAFSGSSLSASAVCRWEAGTFAPSMRYRRAIAEVLGVNPDDLYDDPKPDEIEAVA